MNEARGGRVSLPAAPEVRSSYERTRMKPGDRVVVIGAGPAGLTAAYLLAKDGTAHVTVLEETDAIGGISQTARYKAFRFDIGGHRFFTKVTEVEALWKELLGEDLITVPRLSRIHYRGRFLDYPLRPANALRALGVIDAARIIASYVKWHYWPYPVEDTFEQWVTNRFGKRLFEMFFQTYTEKVWGLPCTEIRAEWAAQRIKGLSLAQAILNASAITRRSHAITSLIHEFKYPRLGPGQMWEACRDRIVERGHTVLTQHAARELLVDGDRVSAVRAMTPDGLQTFPADHVITTMPLKALMGAVKPDLPGHIRAAGEQLSYRDFIVVALVIRQPALFPDNWLYIHTPGVKVGRIQNFNNWSAAMNPVEGTTCLGMEYFCFEGDELWNQRDDALIRLASEELQQLGLAVSADVIDGTVVRMPKAYPVYDAAYRRHLQVVRHALEPIVNLHTIGRNGMHKYNNQDHSMLTAMLTVQNLQGAAHDIWQVNTDLEYHEEQRTPATEDREVRRHA